MQQVPLSALNIAKNLIGFDLPKNKIHKQTDTIEELSKFLEKGGKTKILRLYNCMLIQLVLQNIY
jgi:flagellin-specific chaperone FliS